MRKLIFTLTVILALTALSWAPSAYCADCNQAEHDCVQLEIQVLNDCCNIWGCEGGWSANYCAGQMKEAYKGCMILKGCTPLRD